jgi:hypothetical protein
MKQKYHLNICLHCFISLRYTTEMGLYSVQYSTHSSSIVPNLGDTFGPTSSLLSIVISGSLLPVPSIILDVFFSFFSFFSSSFLSCPVLACPFRPALSVQSFPMLVYPASSFPFTLLCPPLSCVVLSNLSSNTLSQSSSVLLPFPTLFYLAL